MPTPVTFDEIQVGTRLRLAAEYDDHDERDFVLPVGTGCTVIRIVPDFRIKVRWDDGLVDEALASVYVDSGWANERWYFLHAFELEQPTGHAAEIAKLFGC